MNALYDGRWGRHGISSNVSSSTMELYVETMYMLLSIQEFFGKKYAGLIVVWLLATPPQPQHGPHFYL